MPDAKPTRSAVALALAALAGLLAAPAVAQVAVTTSNNLTDLIEQVGPEYAEAYVSPLAYSLGPNQNSALFHTARIPWASLTLGFGIKAMGTKLAEEDQTFRRVVEVDDLGTYFPGQGLDGQSGIIVMDGPTIAGDTETNGSVTGYVNDVPVATAETIPGLVDTRWVPLAAPEAWIGGVFGLKATFRWVPSLTIDDYGKTKYFGWGVQWSPNGLLPNPLPVDLMVGFFRQDLDLGKTLDTDAESYFVAASKGFGVLTLYAGAAAEKATLNVRYTEESTQVPIALDIEADMKSRFTLGATLDTVVKLNGEVAFGKMTVYSVGLLFGL